MRKIKTSDIFKASRILKDAGIAEEFSRIYEKSKGKSSGEVGVDAVVSILGACTTTESEKMIYDLLDGIVEKDVSEMDLDELVATLKQISAENNLMSFFSQLSRLTN